MRQCEKHPKIILIGASTGGPQVLTKILSGLPGDFKPAIVISQHMPVSFINDFVTRLNNDSSLTVVIAKEGNLIESGMVYVSVGDKSLEVVEKAGVPILSYTECGVGRGFCPSVNSLFSSALNIKSADVLMIILTGIGNDGTDAVLKLDMNKTTVWAQEEKDCTAYGMPKAVIETGRVNCVLSVDDISRELRRV